MTFKQPYLLQIAALWFPLLIATPLIIIMQNPDDFTGNIYSQSAMLVGFCAIMVLLTWVLISTLTEKHRTVLVALITAVSTALVIQGYFIHDLFDYGQLNGQVIKWKNFGVAYWLETTLFVVFVFLFYKFYHNKPRFLKQTAVVIIVFSLAQVALVAPKYFQSKQTIQEEVFDDSVFEFSSTENILHILADGFQSDIVKQVLEENPKLAKEFSGFTFFENHLGHFQSTAPTIPSIFTGKIFDLDKGYISNEVGKDIKKNAYTNVLFNNGYRLDFAGISNIYCHQQANSCVNKSFNNLKSRGYLSQKTAVGGLMLLVDISLFRHTPMTIKKGIYSDGAWLLSKKIPNGWSLYPDPIIREWTQHMEVVTSEPVYKWHHFIGTHIPAQWDADCNFLGRQPQSRGFYKAQAQCILKDMANLFRKLKQENIYDITTIVINGDHGCNIPANDLFGTAGNKSAVTDAFIGSARPTFMFKAKHKKGGMVFNDAPTTLEDIAPTILQDVGLQATQYEGVPAFNKANDNNTIRNYHRYISNTFWTGKPVAYTKYSVDGNIRDRENWQVVGLKNRGKSPTHYDHMSYDTAYYFSKGLTLPKSKNHKQKFAAIYGTEFQILLHSNNQLSKQLTLELKVPNTSKNQSLKVYINNQLIESEISLEPIYDKFFVVNITVPKELIKSGNNFFNFVFSKAGMRKSNVPISAYIKSLSFH